MSKIINYSTVISEDMGKLWNDVNAFISEGWQPFGGVAIMSTPDFSKIYYVQAVVEYSVEQ